MEILEGLLRAFRMVVSNPRPRLCGGSLRFLPDRSLPKSMASLLENFLPPSTRPSLDDEHCHLPRGTDLYIKLRFLNDFFEFNTF